ncbi:MAG: ATP synthase F1 subunit delta [Nitrospirae bacterium]|nr:ATP synthase F1 subunit delta [Nitrospirota bacterium]
MKSRIIAERYANALLSVAEKTGEMDKVLEELIFLRKLLYENPNLKRFLESPHIAKEERFKLVRKTLSPLLSQTSVNFVLLLGTKYRLAYLTEIAEEYQRLYDIEKTIHRADVLTASPLDTVLREKLDAAVERIMKKKAALSFYVDESIIGGVVIKTPNMIIDGSVRKQLKDMASAMSAL